MLDKRVLVTGADGFIGSHLVKRLLNLGAKVDVFLVENFASFRLIDLINNVTVHTGDITDRETVRCCLKRSKPQIVFHLAASRCIDRDIDLLGSMIDINLKGTMNLLQTIIEENIPIECFINTGTCEEYGDGCIPFMENQREIPVSPYSASKVATTFFCQMIVKTSKLPIVTLRPFLTYGPGQDKDMFIPSLIDHCLKGKDFLMTDGKQTREYNYVEDIVEGYICASMCPAAIGEIINLGNGIEYKIIDVARKIVNMMGNHINLNIGALPKRGGEAEHFFCCNEKAKYLLNWAPKIGLDEGLSKTIEWYARDVSVKRK